MIRIDLIPGIAAAIRTSVWPSHDVPPGLLYAGACCKERSVENAIQMGAEKQHGKQADGTIHTNQRTVSGKP